MSNNKLNDKTPNSPTAKSTDGKPTSQSSPTSSATDQPLPKTTQTADTTTFGDNDNDQPYMGTTLNSFGANASVNSMTGEVSIILPLVKMPTLQGLGPDLEINLAYNSTSSADKACPYLDIIAPTYVQNFAGVYSAELPNMDWDLDLPAIYWNNSARMLRFQGQSFQFNTNSEDNSPAKTPFYYAKALENNNSLNYNSSSSSVTTPDGTVYGLQTIENMNLTVIGSISKNNGRKLTFNYVEPGWPNTETMQNGAITVTDSEGKQVLSIVSEYPPINGQAVITPVLYVNYSNPNVSASSSQYDIAISFSTDYNVNVSQYAYAEYPDQPYRFAYTDTAISTKVSQMTYPTGAYTVFNWLEGGYNVNYGVEHITAPGKDNIDHTFTYSFAPVDTQYYYDSEGNWLWYRLHIYSTAQANGEGSGGDNDSATYLCPNLNMYDTDEMANGVDPTNNWLDPLFNSTEHSWSGYSDQTGTYYRSGNVSQLIAQQTFTVYETTTYADGTNTASVKTYDALQRLQSEKNYCNGHWWDGQLFAKTEYTYPVSVCDLGMTTSDGKPYALPYPSYQSLPAYFDKPSQVKVTSYPMFNGIVQQTGSPSISITTHNYDDGGNVQSSISASGINKQFSYYTQTELPCNLNPYITSITTLPTGNTSVGALGTISKATYLDSSQGEVAITQSQTCTDYTVINGLLVPISQTGLVNGNAGPITRSYTYNSAGLATAITEFGTGFSTTKTMTYSVDGSGNQTITSTTTYGEGGAGPSLPTVEVLDFLGRTVSTTDSLGRMTNTQYDSLGRVTQKTELANLPQDQQLVTSYQYSVLAGGSGMTVTTPTGAQLIYHYDSLGRETSIQIQPVSGALRTIRSFTYANNTAYGGPCGGQALTATTQIAEGSSITTQYCYNTVGAKIATVPPAGLAQAMLGFSTGDAVYALSFNFIYAPGPTYSITAYGLASLAEMDALTGGTAAVYTFNSSLLQLSGLSGAPLNAVLSNSFIVAGLLADDGSVNMAVMTAANQASYTAYSYDSLFRLVSESLTGDGNTLTTQRGYDVNGRLTQTLDPKGNQFNLAHTAEGFPTQLSLTTESGKGSQYTLATARYNAAGQPTRYAHTPVAAGGSNPNVKTYTFDATTGLATSETDALGNTVNYLYYPTGWLAAAYSQTVSGYYLWSSLIYDRYGAIITQQNGPIATEPTLTNLTPSTPDAVYTYAYNVDGQLESKTVQYAGQAAKTTSYSYDSFGNMNGFSNAFGQSVGVSLDQYGRKSQLQNVSASNVLHQVSYAYDSLGRPSALTKTYILPNQSALSSVVETLTYDYDDLMQTTGLSSQFLTFTDKENLTSPPLGFSQKLSYDLWGNIIGNSQSFIDSAGNLFNQSNQAYTYDEFDRLTGWDADQQGSTSYPCAFNGDGGISSQAFAYDGWDNLQTFSTTLVENQVQNTSTYQYNAQYPCQLEAVSGVGNYAYDALGRVTLDATGNAIRYDALGYVSSVTLKNGMVIDYTYGPNRELIKQSLSDGSALYNYYEGGKLVGRQDQTGTSTFKTLIGLGADSTWTTTDLLGNPVLIKDSSYDDSYQVIDEVVDAKNLFSPTGIQTNLAGANPAAGYPKNLQPTDDASPLLVANSTGGGVGYNSEITDPTTGYQLLGSYRSYDPVSGRFLQPDSASPGIGGINPYAYTSGKFVGCSDPTGHYTYTYQSYNVAKEAIKRAAERQGGFWSRVGKSYLSVAVNIIKHPTNPSGYVAAAMLYCNPSAPLVATVIGEIGKESAVGAFVSGAYAGCESAILSTETLGTVQYNPQTGLGGLNTLGVGNCLGLMSLGYLNMSANGEVQVHSGQSRWTHLEYFGKGLLDFVENMVISTVGVAIGLCYDMPMDIAHGEYYEAGFAFGMNSALLVGMAVAPEDAGGEAAAEGEAAGAGAGANADAGAEAAADEGGAAAHGNEPKGASEVKSPHQSVHEPAGNASHATEAKPSSPTKTTKLGHFVKKVGEHMSKEMVMSIGNADTYNNLNMTDPRSPWSTAAWQNMVYRQGPYTPDKQ